MMLCIEKITPLWMRKVIAQSRAYLLSDINIEKIKTEPARWL